MKVDEQPWAATHFRETKSMKELNKDEQTEVILEKNKT